MQKAYDVMCRADGECETVAPGGVKAVLEAKYAADEKDEFVNPTGLLSDGGYKRRPRPPHPLSPDGRAALARRRGSGARGAL